MRYIEDTLSNLSADARPGLIQRHLDQGARAFLTKPWTSGSCSSCSTPSPPTGSGPAGA